MNLSILSKIKHPLAYGLLILALAIFLVKGQEERENRIKAEAQVHEQQSLQEVRDSAQKEKDEALTQLIKAMTPQKAIPVLQASLQKQGGGEKASQEVIRTLPGAQLPQSITEGVPDAPTANWGILAPSQLTLLGQRELTCQKVEGDLTTCEQDKKNKDNQISELQTALKGGTKFTRFKKAAKCLAVSGLGAGGGAFFYKSHPAQGAALGAILGGGICQIAF